MRISEIWTRAEVDEINVRLRRAAAEQDRTDAEFSVETAEERAFFVSAMYGGDDNSHSDFEEAKLEKQWLANRKLALEIENYHQRRRRGRTAWTTLSKRRRSRRFPATSRRNQDKALVRRPDCVARAAARFPVRKPLPHVIAIEHDWDGDRSVEHRLAIRAWCDEHFEMDEWHEGESSRFGHRYRVEFAGASQAILFRMMWGCGAGCGWRQ